MALLNGEGGGGGSADIEVANYAALPAAGTAPGQTYIVLADQGTKYIGVLWGGNFYPKGFYYDATTSYIYSEYPFQATQAQVDAGTNTTEFVTSKTFNDSAQLTARELIVNKDASGGYVGLTLFKINFRNTLNTFTSFFTNNNTAARTYTFQDRNGTIADDTDLGLKATIDSQVFTGTPSLPTGTIGVTQATNDNSTKLATTAYVKQEITNNANVSNRLFNYYNFI